MKKLIVLIIVSLLLMACATITAERGRKFDPSLVDKIEIGKTTETDVLNMLGSPYRTKLLADGGKELLYGYAQASGNMFSTKIETSLNKAIISFDKKGVVKSIEKTTGS